MSSSFVPSVIALSILAPAIIGCGDSPAEPEPGPPTVLAFVSEPGDAVAAQAIAPAIRVEVRDADGERVPDARNAVTLRLAANPGGADLAGTTVVEAVNGVATFVDVSLANGAAGYTLAAEAPGLASATSAAFDVSAGPPAKLAFLTQPPGTAEGQVAFGPIVVGVEDAFGNPVSGAPMSVALADHASGAVLSGTLMVSSAAGEASFPNLSVALPGDGFVLLASSGEAVIASEAFDVRLTFAQVTAGGSHTCGMTTAGFAYCWGVNQSGQIGDGTNTTRPTPVPVVGRLGFVCIAVGAGHNCGITTTGAVYCWGAGWGSAGRRHDRSPVDADTGRRGPDHRAGQRGDLPHLQPHGRRDRLLLGLEQPRSARGRITILQLDTAPCRAMTAVDRCGDIVDAP